MAFEEPEDQEETVIDLEEPEGDTQSPEDNEEQDEQEEFAIEIDGEEPEDETPLMRNLREQIRDRDRELSNYRKAAQPKIEVGEEPSLESCEWDDLRYKTELLAWNDRKTKAESAENDAQRAAQVRNEEQQKRFISYRAAAETLPVKDFSDAEGKVVGALPELLQSALLAYAKEPAKVVYALAKHPAKLAQLAQEADPIKFVLAVHELERNLKVVNRKKPPAPEADTIQRGSAPISANADKKLAALEKEAEKSGDRTKVIAYKKSLKK